MNDNDSQPIEKVIRLRNWYNLPILMEVWILRSATIGEVLVSVPASLM